jgi:hypothetical protein
LEHIIMQNKKENIDGEYVKPTPSQIALIKKLIGDLVSPQFFQTVSLKTKLIDTRGSFLVFCNKKHSIAASGRPVADFYANDLDTVDSEGPFIRLLVFVRDEHALEVEIYKDTGGPIGIEITADKIIKQPYFTE